MLSRLRTARWIRVPLNVAIVFIHLCFGYLIAANALLSSGLGKATLDGLDAKHHVEWRTASSPWFMQVTGLALRGETSSEEWNFHT